MGSRGRGSTERQGSGTRSGPGRFVLAGSGSNPPEHAHSLHSTTQGAHRSGSRLRTIPRRSVIGRPGKIKAIEELVSHSEKISVKGGPWVPGSQFFALVSRHPETGAEIGRGVCL